MKVILILSAAAIYLTCAGNAVANSEASIEKAANEFSKAAEACLLDVRDKQIPYSKSTNCKARLFRTSKAYINHPGVELVYDGDVIPKHAYIAANAKIMAWSAAALSNAMFRNVETVISLW